MVSVTSSLFLTLLAGGQFNKVDNTVKLTELQEVTHTGGRYYGKTSISGQAFTFAIWAGNYGTYTAVYEIPKGMDELRFFSGVYDKFQKGRSSTIRIALDGEDFSNPLVPGGSLEMGSKPVEWKIPVTGKKSLQIFLDKGACIGEPTFYKLAKAPTAPVATSKEQRSPNVPTLVSPPEKSVVVGETAILKWKEVPGAISYGVYILANKSQDELGSSSPRIWAATVKDNRYDFKISDLPSGEYLWSVVAFGSKKALGAFSEERLFIVDK